jgi:hypothetical protein
VGQDPRSAFLADVLVAVRDGTLDRAELFDLRGRVDPIANEFEPGPILDAVRAAVAEALGVQPGDLPDSEPVPDTVPAQWVRGERW